jgi:uncharacterized lipoprotein NlpE involved in copper resistance
VLKKAILLLTVACMLILSGCNESNNNQGISRERYDSLYEEKEELRYLVEEIREEKIALERELFDANRSLANFALLCDKYGIEWYNEIETYVDIHY